MLRFPSTPLSRRRLLAVGAGTAGLALVGGCALPADDRGPDPLLELLEAAARDAREFAVADVSHGDHVTALRALAETRRLHAERLGDLGEQLSPRVDAGATGSAAPAPDPVCPPVELVRDRLRADARAAAEVAAGSDGRRAEVVAAVSAACAAAAEVVLA